MELSDIVPGTHLYELATTDSRYRSRWSIRFGLTPEQTNTHWPWRGIRSPAPLASMGPLCQFWGGRTGSYVACDTCSGRAEVCKCSIYGSCTILNTRNSNIASCTGCLFATRKGSTKTFPEITTRDLLYHVFPLKNNSVWLWNVQQLRRRLRLFNGRRIVAITTGPECAPPEEVKEAIGDVDTILVRNDPSKREVASFFNLFASVESLDENRAVFYGHAKGVSRPFDSGSTIPIWTELLYEANLDYWPMIGGLLKSYPTVGALKKLGRGFVAPPNASESVWHYSGSFFWFRSKELFSQNWRRIDNIPYGIEPYISLHFNEDQAGSIFKTGVISEINMYSMPIVEKIKKDWESWKIRHAKYLLAQ